MLRTIRERLRRARRGREEGISTVEVVIGTPIIFGFGLLVVNLGLYVNNISRVQAAAEDAARIESVQSSPNPNDIVQLAAAADLPGTCNRDAGSEPVIGITQARNPVATPPGYPQPQYPYFYTDQVTVTCDISVMGFNYTVTAVSTAPTDAFHKRP